jgi:hypothetical protein
MSSLTLAATPDAGVCYLIFHTLSLATKRQLYYPATNEYEGINVRYAKIHSPMAP